MNFDKLINLYLENIAHSTIRNHNEGMKNKEELLSELIEVLKELEDDEVGSYSYDSNSLKADEIWAELNKLGMSTKDINLYCQKAGVL